jgi:Iron-containing redox enzyme
VNRDAFAILAAPGYSAAKARMARAVVRHAARTARDGPAEPLVATQRHAVRIVANMLAPLRSEPAALEEALGHLEQFVVACRAVFAGVLDVKNFGQPAAHAIFALVERSVLTHALHELALQSSRSAEPRRHEPTTTRSFEVHLHVDPAARLTCSVVLALGQYPVERLAELAGFAATGTRVLAVLSRDRSRYRGALRALEIALSSLAADGVACGARIFTSCVHALASASAPAPAQRAERAARMFERKARYAMLHHGAATLGDRRLVEWFSDKPFTAASVLGALYESPWIDRAEIARSPFFTKLTTPGGKMFGVFAPAELALLQQHFADRARGLIGTAPAEIAPNVDFDYHDSDDHDDDGDAPGAPELAPHDYRGRYFALLDAEQHVDAARLAREVVDETFAELAAIRKATAASPLFEPLPYDRVSVEARISAIYWYQAERIRGMHQLDAIDLQAFHLCFAPLGLIDGCWLRSAVTERTSDAHLLLYGVYADEVGNANHAHNHAHLYTQLLGELGAPIASVQDPMLARAAIPKRAFKAPGFLLALDRVHSEHFPELLGVTLAIEMSGLDGLYERMIARLEANGCSAAYWRLHVSVDNYSTGHARQSLDAVISFMDDAVALYGATTAAPLWLRIWRGFLVMLYLFEIELQVLAGAGAKGRA